MSEFKWHLMDEEVPEEGKGHYIIMGQRGAFYYADEFENIPVTNLHGQFHVPNNRRGYKYVREIKAWAEIPPLDMLGIEVG